MKKSSLSAILIGIIWFLVSILVLFAAAQPVSLQVQLFTVIVLLVVISFMKLFPLKRYTRVLFLGLCSFVVLRYLFWRTANTIPPIDDLWSFIPGLMLYLAELYAIFVFFMSMFVVMSPLRRPRGTAIDDENLPAIDVYVPTYNEDEELLGVTLTAATNMRYPKEKLKVYLLDDGGTDEKCNQSDAGKAEDARDRKESLTKLCESLGVNYMTREENDSAKAGNLNAAFHRTDGDLIVVFDADHVPTEDFLEKTVGYFQKDEKLFLVQTPHFFINPDPVERNLGTFEDMPSENEMFYRYIQRGLDKWNATFFCGSAAVLRRDALEEVDGFVGKTITEDAETALELHSSGWKSLYHDEPLIAGLQPESFVEFIHQRSRWAQGMMQIFILKNPLLKPGLSVPQRLCYSNSAMFWLFPFARLMFFIAPLLYIFFRLEIYQTTVAEFIAYTLPYMVVVLVSSNFLFGAYRWPFMSELYEYVQSMYTSRAIINVFLSPFSPKFRVTAKGHTLNKNSLSPLWLPMFLMLILLTVGLFYTAYRYMNEPDLRGILLVVGGWNLLNLIVAVAAFGVVCEKKQRRIAPRMPIKRPVRLLVGDKMINARVDDTSIGGVRVSVPQRLARQVDWQDRTVSIRFTLNTEEGERAVPVLVRSARAQGPLVVLGLKFEADTEAEKRDIVRLMYANSKTWSDFQNSRYDKPGVLVGVWRFLKLAISTSFSVFGFISRVSSSEDEGGRDMLSSSGGGDGGDFGGGSRQSGSRNGSRKKDDNEVDASLSATSQDWVQ